MYTHKAERFYFEEYASHILPFFQNDKSLLDIGCQMGRFTIPAANAGMKITATDIKSGFFRFIKRQLKGYTQITFRKENLHQTCKAFPPESFDVILCVELLYNLPDPAENIQKLASLLKPGGVLITSHRTPGYYIYRFVKTRDFEAINQVMEDTHPHYNAQTVEELKQMLRDSNLYVKCVEPIGMFSGFGKDAFTCFANPGKLKSEEKAALKVLETDRRLKSLFCNNARYLLAVGKKTSNQ